jgi:hypothetical protein
MQVVNNPDNKRQIMQVINELVRQVNATGTCMLTTSATTTTVTDRRITPSSVVVLSPIGTAKTVVPGIAAKATGSFTIGHTTASAGMIVDYVIFGI